MISLVRIRDEGMKNGKNENLIKSCTISGDLSF